MQRLQDIRDSIARVDAVLTDKAEGDTGTNFALAYQTIDSVRRAMAMVTGSDSDAVAQSDGFDPVSDGDSGQPSASSASVGGRIQSRSDVMKTIDAIVDYYARQEPGSPIPVVLGRVKSWVNMDFMSILNDIAPNSVDDAKRVLTARNEDD
jgi:type VI secretion system protein ImpA